MKSEKTFKLFFEKSCSRGYWFWGLSEKNLGSPAIDNIGNLRLILDICTCSYTEFKFCNLGSRILFSLKTTGLSNEVCLNNLIVCF